jgi:hypothetical protein
MNDISERGRIDILIQEVNKVDPDVLIQSGEEGLILIITMWDEIAHSSGEVKNKEYI